MFSLRLDVCLAVTGQHGHVCRAGKSITHTQQWRHHMTACGLVSSSLVVMAVHG